MTMIPRGDVSSPTSLEMPSGVFVELTDPSPSDIWLEDIAYNLARETRYGGSCAPEYTVAEHAVLVARRLRAKGADPATVMEGLHHDDPEAFLKDIPRPLKRILGPAGYDKLEALFAERIAVALGFWAPEIPDAFVRNAERTIKVVDEWALSCEAKALMPSEGIGWAPPWEGSKTAAAMMLQSVSVGGRAAAMQQYLAEHELCVLQVERWARA